MSGARYVYYNVEVVLTGKRAERKLSSGKVDVLHEITPADSSIGSWKKWVSLQEMHLVIDGGE